jgi:ribose 5-phosphate isomerase A
MHGGKQDHRECCFDLCTNRSIWWWGVMSLVEKAKEKAAHAAVNEYIVKHLENADEPTPLVVGIGSGSTIVYAVERLIEVVAEAMKANGGKGRQVVCIPTSFQATQLIQDAPHGVLHLGDLARYAPASVRAICGEGGGAYALTVCTA